MRAFALVLAFVVVACGGEVTTDKPEAGPCDPFTCSLDCASKCPNGAVGTCGDAGCECDCIQ